MLWLYNFLFPFLFLLFVPLALLQRRPRTWVLENLHPGALLERLGLRGPDPGARLWIHAASVGEMRSLEKLLRVLRRAHPDLKIHLSCMSASGLDFARRELVAKSLARSAALAPLDWLPFTALYSSRMKELKVLAVAETELWPNLITSVKRRGGSVIWLNARMSYKTLRWIRPLRPLASRIFSSFDRIALSSAENLDALREFVHGQELVSVTGNLKWDMEIPQGLRDPGSVSALRSGFGWRHSDFVWTAGSVREGEEEMIVNAFRSLSVRHPELRLVLAPRHPQRVRSLERLLKAKGLAYAPHSRPERAPIALIDRMGVLLPYYAASSAVFIGGTLVDKIGGHNFLEPAALAKPVVIGPYFENFREIADKFRAKHSIAVAPDGGKLEEVMSWWISHPEEARAQGLKAYETFHSFQGASETAAKMIGSFL